MADRRRFLKTAALGVTAAALSSRIASALAAGKAAGMSGGRKPRVISTWDFGVPANLAAWAVLAKGGRALDAVEAGVMIRTTGDIIALSPPLIIEKSEIDRIFTTIREVLATIE